MFDFSLELAQLWRLEAFLVHGLNFVRVTNVLVFPFFVKHHGNPPLSFKILLLYHTPITNPSFC